MWWIAGGLLVWLVLGLLFAVVIGRGIALADERSVGTGHYREPAAAERLWVASAVAAPRSAALRHRASIPVPPVALAMAAVALVLESIGYVVRLTGSHGETARLLSMDAPFSAPRLYVAGLFAVAAFAAVAGAARNEGRRTWWLVVGLIAAGISAIKVGATLHHQALDWLAGAVGGPLAVLAAASLAASVIALLWCVSREERRDRRRMMWALSLYAFAVVGLSAVSRLATSTLGWASNWAAAATFVEESGEALAGIAYLMAVLVGVAPRLVLPMSWPLRRTDDDLSLQPSDELLGHLAPGPRQRR